MDKNKLDQGWDNDHKDCCFKALKEDKFKTGCASTDFGLDDKSDGKLQDYRVCILAKLRAKGTSLRQDQNLTCYFGWVLRYGLILGFFGALCTLAA